MFSFFVERFLGAEIGLYEKLMSDFFKETAQLFPEWLCCLTLPPVGSQGPSFSTSSRTLVCLFDGSRPGGPGVVSSGFGFKWLFPGG